MKNLTITLKDQDVIKGYGTGELSDGGYTFIHAEGGQAFIPEEDVETMKVGAVVEGEIKVERPVEKIEKIEKTGLRPLKPGSQLDKVVQIRLKNPEKTRKEILQIIVEEVGMSIAGAGTYYSNANPYVG